MISDQCMPNRRKFLKLSAALTASATGLTSFPASEVAAQDDNAWIIGPKPGFSPEIGTLVSMMAFTRMQVMHNTKGMSQQDLDFLIDGKANTIGALLPHLAATDAYYHLNSFQGVAWGKLFFLVLFAGETFEVRHLLFHFFAGGVGGGADTLDAQLEFVGVRSAD